MSNSPQSSARQNSLSAASDIDDRFRVIFDAVNDGIFISNPATGRFIEVNQPGCDMFGYDKAEHLAEHLQQTKGDTTQTLRKFVIEHDWLSAEEFEELTSPERVTRLGSPNGDSQANPLSPG